MNQSEININKIIKQIINDKDNISYTKAGLKPVFNLSSEAKILIIGQAPGLAAQKSGVVFDDKSGEILRDWLNVSKKDFYNADLISILPMDFYYPGKGKTGDLPPRKSFTEKWHPLILNNLKQLKLIILIGVYANKYYLKANYKKNLTETIKNYQNYLPQFFPLVHPSPLNFRWHLKNKWFKEDIIPILRQKVKTILI